MSELKAKICTLCQLSIEDNQYVDSIYFPLSKRAITEISKVVFRAKITEYKFEINSHDIRHTKKSHPDDFHYVCEIPTIVKDFSKVRLSRTNHHKTGKPIQSIEFYKKYGDEEVKLVKVDLLKEKILRLKTIFVHD